MVVVMNDDLAEERIQHGIPLVREQGVWHGLAADKVLPWAPAGVAPLAPEAASFAAVGWGGQVVVAAGAESRREGLERRDGEVAVPRAARLIDGAIHTAGLRRQVFRRSGEGRWNAIDQGVAASAPDPPVGFNAIDGFSTDEIYAVGLDGEIWTRGGGIWRKLAAPTNVHLHCLCCAANGKAYAGGRNGVLLEGRGDSWALIDVGLEETIWSLQWFEANLFLVCDSEIYRVAEGTAELVGNPLLEAEDFHTISLGGQSLWFFASKAVVRFDGSRWDADRCRLAEPVDPDLQVFFDNRVVETGSIYLDEEDD